MHTSRLITATQKTTVSATAKRICPATIIAVTTRIGRYCRQSVRTPQASKQGLVACHDIKAAAAAARRQRYLMRSPRPSFLQAAASGTMRRVIIMYDLGVLTGLVQVVIVGVCAHHHTILHVERGDQRVSIRESPRVISPERRSRKPKYTDAVNLSSVQVVDLKIQRSGSLAW
jgi:hypothetical protein